MSVDVNHNFQPQRSHLNCSSGFSLEAVLPQRGHFMVHICVKGPSGVTLKIWNVDSIVASFNRRLIGIRWDAIRFVGTSGSTALNGEVSPAKSISWGFQNVVSNSERTSRYRVISSSDIATCRTGTKGLKKLVQVGLALAVTAPMAPPEAGTRCWEFLPISCFLSC
jgi:hypothetical protein